MKKILSIIALSLITYYTQAQTCKIKIYYDANGNRTQRVMECGDEIAPPDKVELQTVRKKMDGFNDLTSGTYQVYPNPAENKVNIRLDADLVTKECSISLIDITGKALYQQRTVTDVVSAIDLQGYADGAYFIVISTGNEKHTVKIVKQTGSSY